MIIAGLWFNDMILSRQQQIVMLQTEIAALQQVDKSKLYQLAVNQIGLSRRTSNALFRGNINCVADLMIACDNKILLNIPGIGPYAIDEIMYVLEDIMFTGHDKQSWLDHLQSDTDN